MGVLSSTLATLALVVVANGPDVRGDAVCPSADEVAVRLGPMLSAETAFPSGTFVELADVPGRVSGLSDVEIRLRNVGQDSSLAVRRVERGGGCGETADAVAVIAASWVGRYVTPAPPSLPDSALPEPAATIVRGELPDQPAPSSATFSIGALGGIVAAVSGGSAALAGVEVEARRGRWVARLTMAGMGERTVDISQGSAGWRRVMVLPNVGMSWGSARAFAELDAGAAVAVTETRGSGFVANSTDTGIDVGIVPAFRLGARLAALPATVWIGGSALVWLRPHGVSVGGGASTKPLPRLDGFLGAGLTFLFDS